MIENVDGQKTGNEESLVLLWMNSVLRMPRRRLLVRSCLLALILLVALSSIVRVPYASTVQPASTGSIGEIVGPIEVGQLFESTRAHIRGVGFQIATYSGRENTEDVLFELREHPNDREPLRTVRVNARAFRDHQLYTFSFPPIAHSLGKTYYASLRSPTSTPGNAITLDFSATNPYRKVGPTSLVVVRTARTGARDVLRGAKPGADLTFTVVHHIPLSERLRLLASDGSTALRRDPARWSLDARLAGAAVLLAVFTVWVSRWNHQGSRARWIPLALGGLFVAGLFIRLQFASRLPLTNDEGTALYDARTILRGSLPGGDGVLKTPTYVGVLASGLAVLGSTPSAGRTVSVLAALLTTLPLMRIGRVLLGRRNAGLALAALWLLGASPVILSVYAHAQPVQLFFGLLALALFATALQGDQRSSRWRRGATTALAAGILLGIAIGARKTSIAFVLPAGVLFFGLSAPWTARLRTGVLALIGCTAVLGAFVLLEHRLYGTPGVGYFLGLDVARIDPATTGSAEERSSAFIKGVLPYFRESLPLTFLALIGLGGTLERVVASGGRPLARLAWLAPLALVWFGGVFLRNHERTEQFAFGVWPAWVTMGVLILFLALLPRRREEVPSDRMERMERWRSLLPELMPLLVPVAWLLALGVVYGSWIKFTANYLAEFLPPIVLLAAAGVCWFSRACAKRNAVTVLIGVFLTWAAFTSLRSGYTFPHTGTFDPSSVQDAANIVKAQIPRDEPILTAALAVPIVSGHRVPFDVAHPTHYAYGFIEPSVRNIYMAPAEEMESFVLENVQWMILERLTTFSYFREYPAIERLAKEQFVQVAEIENLNNPLTILRRKNL